MHTFTLKIPGFSIAGKAHGNPDGLPILALHGWLDNANSFDLLAPQLSDSTHLMAIDLPGHGHSSHLPPGCHYHFIDGIFAVLQMIEALGMPQKVHLLGHSMGACLASLIAAVAPESIASIALIEGLGPLSAPVETCQAQLSHYAGQWLETASKPARPYPSLEMAARARAKSGYLPLELATILCERGVREENGHWYWRHDRRLLTHSPLRMTEAQVLNCLSCIKVPGILFMAENGFDYPADIMKTRMQAVAGLKVEYLPGGHHLHMESPDIIGKKLLDFYRNI